MCIVVYMYIYVYINSYGHPVYKYMCIKMCFRDVSNLTRVVVQTPVATLYIYIDK